MPSMSDCKKRNDARFHHVLCMLRNSLVPTTKQKNPRIGTMPGRAGKKHGGHPGIEPGTSRKQ